MIDVLVVIARLAIVAGLVGTVVGQARIIEAKERRSSTQLDDELKYRLAMTLGLALFAVAYTVAMVSGARPTVWTVAPLFAWLPAAWWSNRWASRITRDRNR